MLQTPENKVDFAEAKLEIDSIIDPTTDKAAIRIQLDQMTREVSAMMPFTRRIMSVDKVETLIAYLYQPGAWNKQQVFKYDLQGDPTGGTIFANKLLAVYLKRRLGNCVSMPILFAILGQKIGLHNVLSTAPNHVFVKFKDERGNFQNVEATTGGAKLDSSYQKQFNISQKAIDNGVYLQVSTKQQSIAVMIGTLMEHYYYQAGGLCDGKPMTAVPVTERNYLENTDRLNAVSYLMLEFNPKDVVALLNKGAVYILPIERKFRTKYKRYEDIPDGEKQEANQLIRQQNQWYAKAESLGWQPETEESRKAYLQMVGKAAKSRQ